MESNKINAISTAVIAFVTIIGLMVGFYYNLKASDISMFNTIIFELIFVITAVLFTLWVRRKIKNEE